jgi:hypothetical protein
MIAAMERVFWGADTSCDACARFHQSWEAASEAPKPPRTPRPAGGPATLLEPRSSRRPGNLALLDMAVEATSQGSSADDFGLLADMRYGLDPLEDASAAFGLSRITLRYEETGCQPAGERYADQGPVNGVKAISGGWEFTATTGDVLDGRFADVLARFVRGTAADQPGVTFHATGHTDDLRPRLSGDLASATGKARGVLGRYLAKRLYRRNGIIPLGSASLRWSPKR